MKPFEAVDQGLQAADQRLEALGVVSGDHLRLMAVPHAASFAGIARS